MTISTTTNSVQYNGNGVTTVFAVPFTFYESTDLIVNSTVVATGTSTTLILDTDYNVSGGDGSTGSITTSSAVASGIRLTIERQIPYTQEDDFLEGNTVQAQVVEEAFDRSVILTQQLAAALAITVKFPTTDPFGLNTEIPSSVDRASKLLGFDASGNVTVLSDSQSSAAAAAASAAAAAASAASISLPIAISSGGTGQTGKTSAFDALSPATTKGDIIVYNGTDNVRLPVGTNTYALVADSTQAAGLAYAAVSSFPTSSFTDKVLYGLTVSNNVTDPTNDIDVAVGSCVSDDGTTLMTLTAITKRLDAAWVVGTNQGGLDTGSIANTTYHVWVINRPDTNVTDVLFSTSASAPTMPSNYTKKKCIGSIIRESGAIVLFIQYKNEFWRKTPVTSMNSVASSTTAALQAFGVPSGVKFGLIATAAVDVAANTLVYFSDPDAVDAGPASGIFSISHGSTNAGGGQFRCYTNTSSQVRVRSSVSARNITAATLGWVDLRI